MKSVPHRALFILWFCKTQS